MGRTAEESPQPVTGEHPVVARGLVKHYGQFLALDDVSFDIRGGQTQGLLGPNGAGKTTLIRTLLGFLPYSEGSVTVMGHQVSAAPLAARQRVGYMPENEALFPGLTGFEAVAYAGRLSGMPREAAYSRAYEVLDYLGMDEVRHRPVEGYSVGLKQKVKLAQAVVHGPSLVLLDEPLSGLDPNSREEMIALLRGIAASGVAMVLSSHVLHDVENLCSSVLMRDRGAIIYDGPLERLSAVRRGRFRVRIKGDPARFKEELERENAEVDEQGADLVVMVEGECGTEVIWAAAKKASAQVRELQPSRDSLEQSFLKLLGKGEA